jgi:hypothetical protein
MSRWRSLVYILLLRLCVVHTMLCRKPRRVLSTHDLSRCLRIFDKSDAFFRPPSICKQAIEDLDEALQAKLGETNKRDSDLDPVLEALYGEEMLGMERERGNPEFMRRETCVKWLHVAGGY